MDLDASFKINNDAEVEGVWIPVAPDFRIKVARHMNPRMREWVRAEMSSYRELINRGQIKDEVVQRVNREATAKFVLLDWEGSARLTIDGEKQDLGPHSPERALQLLEALPEFEALVAARSQDMKLFLAQEEAKAEGNLRLASDGG